MMTIYFILCHCYQNNLLLTWICAQGIPTGQTYAHVMCAQGIPTWQTYAHLMCAQGYTNLTDLCSSNVCTSTLAGLTAHLNLCPRSQQNRCSPQFAHNVYCHDRLITHLRSCTRCVVMRAPEAPTGWPSAMAPPLTFNFSRSSFSSFWQAKVWAPNASLICNAKSFTLHC